jgi:cytochrome P450
MEETFNCKDTDNCLKGGFATADHDHHRLRRSAVNRFFSKQSIAKFEPVIHELTQRLCNKLLDQSSEPFDITNAFSCFTTDVVTSYCFGQKKGFLDQPEFTPNLRPAIIGGCTMLPTVRQWPNLFGLVQSLPEYVTVQEC